MILCTRCNEQVESDPYFIFYRKLCKKDFISELINLNRSFNKPFKISVKAIAVDARFFSIPWWFSVENFT